MSRRDLYRRSPLLLVVFLIFTAAYYFVLSLASESIGRGSLDALAPMEIVAQGLREPTGIAIDASGTVFVSDRRAGTVLKIVDGEVESVLGGLGRPVGLAFDADGSLLIVDEKAGQLLRLQRDGPPAILAEGMKKPRWVAVAGDGTIYVTAKRLRSARDKKGDADDEDDGESGEVIIRLGLDGLSIFASGIKGLQGIAVHETSIFAVANGLRSAHGQDDEERGGVLEIPVEADRAAGRVSRFTSERIKKPVGISRDRLGALYFSAEEIFRGDEKKKKNAIGKLPPNGALNGFASQLSNPRGIAFDPQGDLFVADGNSGRVILFRAPPAPQVSVPAFTNQSLLAIGGTTEANSRVDAFFNDSKGPITVTTTDGIFSLILNPDPDPENLLNVFTTAHIGQGLTSAPAEFTIVHDNMNPLVLNLQPTNASFLNDQRPLLRANFSDNLSGVDVGRVKILLDKFNITPQAQLTASGFTIDPLVLSLYPLGQGRHTVTVSIYDRAGNSALASSTFNVDVTAPRIANLTPTDGFIVTTAQPTISAQFSDNLSGINLASVRVLLDGEDVTTQSTITGSGFSFTPSMPLAPGLRTASVSLSDLAGNSTSASSSFTVSLGAQLDPIGDKVVNLGETLSFMVSATSPGPDAVSFFVAPLPLPNHAAFDASTGLFTFTPDTTQVGSFRLSFSAVSGHQSDSETITITVPEPLPGGLTAVRGRVYNLNNTPLGNVKVTLKATGHTVFSTDDGFFTISDIPAGRQELIVNGRQANLGVFAILAVPVDLIEGVLNSLPSAITLPDVDTAAEVQVSPTFTTVVTNPSVPDVEFTIPGGTAKNPDGTPFTGKLSINPVPDYGRPESRPEELRPGMAITIQPAGVRFDPPARLTFPNADGVPPGSELNLWSLSPDTGTFNPVGKMVVSADGQSIVTVEGGVTASAWHFPLAPSASASSAFAASRYCASGNCSGVGSEANLEEGSLFLSHTLPSYRSFGQSRSLTLTYSSVTADPRPIISLDATLSVRAAVPNSFSTKLEVGGVQQSGEVFTDTRNLPEDSDSTSRISVQFDASNLPTGRYPYSATIFSNYQNSSIGGITTGNVIVLNRKSSPLGAGWALSDLEQMHLQADGSVLLTTGGGAGLFFSGGPDTFTSPPGEFSTLIKNTDATFTRTLKDGTKFNFNSQGLQISVVDRNGNATNYAYDASARLLTITDPAGLVTAFTYAGEKLQKITDPAGRGTVFEHDSAGSLTRITNPDSTFVTYAYDDKGRLIQLTDGRGNATTYAYDFAGRFSQSTRATGETRSLTSSKLQGLANTADGQGTPTNPAPVVQSQAATASLTDGRGNRATFTLDALGQITSQTDALGNTTLIERDANGNPTKVTRPNGAVVRMTYDSRGNLLTSTDPVGATTTFTYEPTFNQVTSIKDPKDNTTTIKYDTRGNPIEIIDALGNRTLMTYDSRGLLTSVASAVGMPEENTTTFTYDTRGNLWTTSDPLLNTTVLEYDHAGNVIKSTDAEGRSTVFNYDPMNRLISVTDPGLKLTRYSYDAAGNLTEVTHAKNQTTTFAYDPLNRLTSTTNPLNLTESFAYDANGNLISTTNRNGQVITFNYDALNRLNGKSRPPTSTEIGAQVTNFSYDSAGNLTSVVNPTIGVFNQYDHANRLISSASTTEEQVSGAVVPINTDTTIGENDFHFEGRSLQVNGRTLTVNGSHIFANLILANGAVLTHSPSTATKINKLDIKITGMLTIDASSRIDVAGRGFLGGSQPGNPFGTSGMTVGFASGSTGRSGGSYGGIGQSFQGSANPVYGNFRDPNEPGSGGGAGNIGSFAGSGGGLVRIVTKTIEVNGTIKADGGQRGCCEEVGGGSGGGIRIDARVIRGTGQITANGGNGSLGAGGGGGRIAIYYQDASAFDFSRLSAAGGLTAGVPGLSGGAATVYLQGPGRESGELIADNNGMVTFTRSTPILPSTSGSLALTNLKATRGAKLRVDDETVLAGFLNISFSGEIALSKPLAATAITLANNGLITQLATSGTAFFKVDLSADRLSIDSTSRIDVTGLGFLGGNRPGNPFGVNGMTAGFQRGSTGRSGGSYGGLGSSFEGSSNSVYGNFRDPNEPGSGGSAHTGSIGLGGSGGGLIRIVAETLEVNGIIKADGGGVGCCDQAGGGSGGGLRIDAGMLSGTGQITANGATGGLGSGGGAGRVAIYYRDATGFDFSRVSAFGGNTAGVPGLHGGAGTIYLQGPVRASGELIADNNNVVTNAQSTPISASVSNLLGLTDLRVKRGARARVNDQLSLSGELEISSSAELLARSRVLASSVSVIGGSILTSFATTATTVFKLELSADTIAVDASSMIDATGKGFLGGSTPGNPFGTAGMSNNFQSGSTGRSGGSYGGLGGSFEGSSNPVYGDFRDPNQPGSGGGARTTINSAASGGGLIRIVAQTLQLNGAIRANGGERGCCDETGGGSGGGIRIDVLNLSGTGEVRADGGRGSLGAGGGGGRVAIYYQTAAGFDFNKVTALGGAAAGVPGNGQAGTVHIEQRIFIGWVPSVYEAPVEAAQAGPVQLASLTPPVIKFGPDFGPVKIPDFKDLIAKMHTELRQVGALRRKVYEPVSFPNNQTNQTNQTNQINQTNQNPYLAMASGSEPLALGSKPSDDFDPTYTYDLNGNRTSMIDPTGLTTYSYDALNRLTSITNNRGIMTTFSYDALGRRTSVTHGNGVVTSYNYDAASQLLSLVHQLGATTINSFSYTYDRVGNRKTKADNNGIANYTYDVLSRLVRATNPLPSNPLETYMYDPVGNRVDSNQNGQSDFNEANQLLDDADFTYRYDFNGNLIQKTAKTSGAITLYEYDAENKLVRAVAPGGVTAIYRYDGLGRRVEKELTEAGSTTVIRYIYDIEDILLELDGANNITARYTHGPGIDEPLIVEKGSASFFYHADGLGSITEITDAFGVVKQGYSYSSFGKIESQLDPNFVQPYTFTCREFDPETGLYFYRVRFYEPQTGRFLQEDPIRGFIGSPQALNLYPYISNNPINETDPFGLQPTPEQLGAPPVTGVSPGIPGSRVPAPDPSALLDLATGHLQLKGAKLLSQEIVRKVQELEETIDCGKETLTFICLNKDFPLGSVDVILGPRPFFEAPTACKPFLAVGRKNCSCPLR